VESPAGRLARTTRPHDDEIPGSDIVHIHDTLRASPPHQNLAGREPGQRPHRVPGAIHGEHLKGVTGGEEGNDQSRLPPRPDTGGPYRGHAHQDVHIQVAGAQSRDRRPEDRHPSHHERGGIRYEAHRLSHPG
jgi:hypothetical protein